MKSSFANAVTEFGTPVARKSMSINMPSKSKLALQAIAENAEQADFFGPM